MPDGGLHSVHNIGIFMFMKDTWILFIIIKRDQIMDDGRFHGKAGSIVIKGVVTINEHCNALGQFPASDQIVEDIRCGETLDHIELMAAYAVHQVNDRIGLCLVVFIVAGRQINRIVAVLLQCLGVPEQRFAGARIGSLGRFLLFEQEIQSLVRSKIVLQKRLLPYHQSTLSYLLLHQHIPK